MLNIEKIRADFPILDQEVYGKPLVYLDNGATTQKPTQVLDAVAKLYNKFDGNIHRGSHYMSDQTTAAYESVRDKVSQFINTPERESVIFTYGTTTSINLVAHSFGDAFINEGDEIIVSELEHHSNIVPWQLMCERRKATLKVLPFNDDGVLMVEKLDELITDKTKLLSVAHISNVLGTINPIEQIIEKCHAHNVKVLIDGAQSIQHVPIDVQALDCDFFVFSGHKLYAPTGVGVLYGKKELLEQMPPFLGGGEMIERVSFSGTTFNELPYKFEAGTPNFIGVVGLGAAIDYIQEIGLDKIAAYEQELLDYATEKISSIEKVKIYGTAKEKSGVISFLINNNHPYDYGMFLDKMGFAVRTGTHCAEPVMEHFGIPGTIRASFAFYNTKEEIDRFCEALIKISTMF